jgi:hypothetical protein
MLEIKVHPSRMRAISHMLNACGIQHYRVQSDKECFIGIGKQVGGHLESELEQPPFRKVTCCWSVDDKIPGCPFRNDRNFSSSCCKLALGGKHIDVDTPDQLPRECPLWGGIVSVGILK